MLNLPWIAAALVALIVAGVFAVFVPNAEKVSINIAKGILISKIFL